MSDNELGKKLVEEEHLLQFLDAYKTVTGIALALRSRGESPDFICAYPSGELVGVELARSPHDYEIRVHDRIWTDCMRSAGGEVRWNAASVVPMTTHGSPEPSAVRAATRSPMAR